jgi:hypothetical protein
MANVIIGLCWVTFRVRVREKNPYGKGQYISSPTPNSDPDPNPDP